MAGIDINRTTTGIALPRAVSSEVWGLTINQSAVMRAARQISIPGSGIQIDTLNGVGDAAGFGSITHQIGVNVGIEIFLPKFVIHALHLWHTALPNVIEYLNHIIFRELALPCL